MFGGHRLGIEIGKKNLMFGLFGEFEEWRCF